MAMAHSDKIVAFPVGEEQMIKSFSATGLRIYRAVTLPPRWEENLHSDRKMQEETIAQIKGHRQMSDMDIAVIVMNLSLFPVKEVEHEDDLISSVTLLVSLLGKHCRSLLILTPGDKEGGRCFLQLNKHLRRALAKEKTCRIVPAEEDEQNGHVGPVVIPRRTSQGLWSTKDKEKYVSTVCSFTLDKILRKSSERRGNSAGRGDIQIDGYRREISALREENGRLREELNFQKGRLREREELKKLISEATRKATTEKAEHSSSSSDSEAEESKKRKKRKHSPAHLSDESSGEEDNVRRKRNSSKPQRPPTPDVQ